MDRKNTERRSHGQRRWGLENEFPLTDSRGILVITERRTLIDRRLDNTSMDERLVMFSGMPQIDPE